MPTLGEHGLSLQADERDVGALSLALGQAGIAILRPTPELATLEDLFFRLTERRRDGAPAQAADGAGAGARRREPGGREVSSVAHAPAAAPAAQRWHRPSTLIVYRWELRKLLSQKRTYLGLFLAVLMPLIFVLSQHLRAHHPHEQDNIFASQITQSGLATPVLMLLFESLFLLPLIASLVAGDIIAAEDGNGTLKTILTRSVDRGQVFAAKTLAAMTYAALAVFLSATVATIAGVASWGFKSITSSSGTVVSAPKALLLVYAANACFLIPLLAIVVHRRPALDGHPQQRGRRRRNGRDHAVLRSSPRSRAWKASARTC